MFKDVDKCTPLMYTKYNLYTKYTLSHSMRGHIYTGDNRCAIFITYELAY